MESEIFNADGEEEYRNGIVIFSGTMESTEGVRIIFKSGGKRACRSNASSGDFVHARWASNNAESRKSISLFSKIG